MTTPDLDPTLKGTPTPTETAALTEHFVDQNRLILSLADLVRSLPDGRTDYVFNPQTNTLTLVDYNPEIDPYGGKLPPSIGIIKGKNEAIIAGSWAVARSSSDTTRLELRFDETDQLTAWFQTAIRTKTWLSAKFEDHDGVLSSDAHVALSLVRNSASLVLEYAGDHQTLAFTDLNRYTPDQLRLIFDNGTVPDIDIQRFIRESLLVGDDKAINRLETPTLTFDTSHFDNFHPRHSRTYLAYPDNPLPNLDPESTIIGIAITEKPETPFKVAVTIAKVEQIPYDYYNEPGQATKITGTVTIEDGYYITTIQDAEFTILGNLTYVQQNPHVIPGNAFAQFYKI